MVLTEQKDTTQYIATMEAAYRAKEDALFDNIPQTSYATASVPGGYPTDGTTSPNDSLARTNGSDNKVGPALVLKVMSGDVVDIGVKSFYRPNGSPGSNSNPIDDILYALASGIVGIAGETKGTYSDLSNTGSSPLLGALSSFITNNNPDPTPTKPKAYLNWILLDEQFNYTEASSGAIVVGAADVLNPLANTGIPITKNGFLYIYVSNETQNWNVFFDNLAVKHYTGPVLEETHYYPFGLTMAGISSKVIGKLENKAKFNGIEHNTDFDLNTYEAFYRALDPQIGRWWQIDPKPNEMWSPYSAMNNDPILLTDPLGDTTWVYSSTGQFLGVVNDKMKNQIHFMDVNNKKATPFDASGLSAKDAKSLAKGFRSISLAFIGSKSVESLQKIINDPQNKSNTPFTNDPEAVFGATISKTREIIFNQVDVKNRSAGHADVGEVDNVLSKGVQAALFGFGHTHPADYTSATIGNLVTVTEPTGPTSTIIGGQLSTQANDFNNMLYRSNGSKGNHAAFIGAKIGFSVYPSGTPPAYPTPGKGMFFYSQFK